MDKLFVHIYRYLNRHAAAFWTLFVLSAGLLGYLGSSIRFSEDITRVFPQSKNAGEMQFLFKNSAVNNRLFFSIYEKDSLHKTGINTLINAAGKLSETLQKKYIPEFFKEVSARQDANLINEKYDQYLSLLPLFLQPEDYVKIDSLLADSVIIQNLRADYKTLMTPMGFATRNIIRKDPLHFANLFFNKLNRWNAGGNLMLYNGYLVSKDKSTVLLSATLMQPNETGVTQKLMTALNNTFGDLEAQYPGVGISCFGGAAVAAGNASRIKKDIILSVSVALLLLMVVLVRFFRKKFLFLVLFLPVVFGALTAFAVLAIVRGEVSAVSLGIGSVLLGISVDYALHLASHFRAGHKPEEVLRALTQPVLMSSTTTALAFLSLNLVQSKMLSDLGLFAAVSVFTASLISLVVLPLIFKDAYKNGLQQNRKETLIDKLAAVDLSKKAVTVTAVVLFSAGFLIFKTPAHFSSDLTSFNYMSPRLKEAEQRLNSLTGNSPKNIYLLSKGKTTDEALMKSEEAGPMLKKAARKWPFGLTSPLKLFLLSTKAQKKAIERWDGFWKQRREQVKKSLISKGGMLGFKPLTFAPFYQILQKEYKPVSPDSFLQLNKQFLSDFVIKTDSLTVLTEVIHPQIPAGKVAELSRFIAVRTGLTVINRRLVTQELIDLLRKDVNRLARYSMLFIFLFLLVVYGRIELAAITALPVFLAWYWTVGVMNILGISFNVFNVVILTFVFGLGIDYSIFITRGLLRQYKYGNIEMSTYRVSVLLSVITTMLGIGVLILAKHPALKSIAVMSVIGVLIVVLLSFVLQPFFFGWLVYNKNNLRKRPVTFLDVVFSLVSLIYFLVMALVLNILVLLLMVLPFPVEKKKLFFHRIFSKLQWSLIYLNFLSKKTIIKIDNEDFSKPAIIISNHQSHADLMLIKMLHPKILVLTNARNYNNPLYGLLLRFADYIPVAEGYEKNLEKIRDRVKHGYSVLVFPEGHRSASGEIKRFHKGAFYLANELNLKILPILLHGDGSLLSKEEFVIRRGRVTTVIYPGIDLKKGRYGTGIREQAKNMRLFYQKEYKRWCTLLEIPEYFRPWIIDNFKYKGPVTEWYARVKIALENNYRFYNERIARNATVTDIGCGYGFLDFMLSLVSEERKITAIDYDEDKIAVANRCAIKNENLNFYFSDALTFDYQRSDVFILNDVLHYLTPEKQIALLEKCTRFLNSGGEIIIRDGDSDLKERHRGTKLTEFFSTKSGFNKTENRLWFLSGKTIEDFAANHHLSLEITDTSKHTSNVVFVLKRI